MRKMVARLVHGVLTSGYGLVNHGRETPPLKVSRQHLQVAGTSELGAGVGMLPNHIFKTRIQSNDNFFVHVSCSPWRHAANLFVFSMRMDFLPKTK